MTKQSQSHPNLKPKQQEHEKKIYNYLHNIYLCSTQYLIKFL